MDKNLRDVDFLLKVFQFLASELFQDLLAENLL